MKKFLGLMLIAAIILQPAVLFAEEENAAPAATEEKASDDSLKADLSSDDLDLGEDLGNDEESDSLKADHAEDAEKDAAYVPAEDEEETERN